MGPCVRQGEIGTQVHPEYTGILHRHDLVDLDAEGRQRVAAGLRRMEAYAAVDSSAHGDTPPQRMNGITDGSGGLNLPGIVRRREEPQEGRQASDFASTCGHDSEVAVGFVVLLFAGGRKLRFPSVVPRRCIKRAISPFEVAMRDFEPRTPALSALIGLRKWLSGYDGLNLGVWGSCALEVYTGLPYTGPDSDLDLLIETDSYERLKEALLWLEGFEQARGVRVDIEVRLPGGWGVNGRELVNGSETLLAKSLHDVRLMPRATALSMFTE
jgi:malonate decarboxylase holo-[acyl-carrier-protein] synthase